MVVLSAYPRRAFLPTRTFLKHPLTVFARVSLAAAEAKGATLVHSKLSQSNLAGANFNGANFSLAKLTTCNLRHTNLSGANFYRAELSQLDLRASDLSQANLRRAKLVRLKLNDSDLCEAAFQQTLFLRVDCLGVRGLDQPPPSEAQALLMCDVRLPDAEGQAVCQRDCAQFPYLLINGGYVRDVAGAEAYLKRVRKSQAL